MSLRHILFDLDGTLLPMDQDIFIKAYFGGIAATLAPEGYDPDKLIKAIWSGTTAMIQNDGSRTNEQTFWDHFCTIFGDAARQDEPKFEAFYRTQFQQVQKVCGFDPRAAQCIAALKEMGFDLILATNPIFPAIATQSRIRWAGLNREDFQLVTTYENSRFCKPNLHYYRQILADLNLQPEECLMVGNDVSEDMVARELGMKVFLLTDCLINRKDSPLDSYPQGSFDALMDYIQALQ